MLLPPPENPDRITIVLDLDETLVHSSFVEIKNPDFRFMLNAYPNPVPVYVLIRPHATEFLEKLAEKFELIIFTASNQTYADYVIDQIDPNHVVSYRLYKESCSDLNGATVKDLSLLNRELKRLIIIDNSKMASLLHPYNAVSVETWTDDKNDHELLDIADELLPHADETNVYTFLVQDDDEQKSGTRTRSKSSAENVNSDQEPQSPSEEKNEKSTEPSNENSNAKEANEEPA